MQRKLKLKLFPLVVIAFVMIIICVLGVIKVVNIHQIQQYINIDDRFNQYENFRILQQQAKSLPSPTENFIDQNQKLQKSSENQQKFAQENKQKQSTKKQDSDTIKIVDQQQKSKQKLSKTHEIQQNIVEIQQDVLNPKNQWQIQIQQAVDKSIQLPSQQQMYDTPQYQQEEEQSPDGIDWPRKKQLYHIYSAINPRMVLDVAKADDGFHDLILYQWQNSLNQMFYFQKVYDNFYHIINAQTKQNMKKSQKIILQTGVSKIKFSNYGERDLWELVPAKLNAKNAFYILSPEKLALDLNEGYADKGAEIIIYDWSKNDNQVWFFRENNLQFDVQENDKEKYQEKLSELLYKVMSNPDSINQCITFEEMKKQMNSKNMLIPSWLSRPQIPTNKISQMPPETSALQHQLFKGIKKPKLKSLKNNDKISDSILQKILLQSQEKSDFKPPKLSLQCAKHHIISYIWYGQKEMPQDYKQLMTKCKKNVRLLTQIDFFHYVQKWNKLEPIYTIDINDYIIRQRINLLKLLYLFFESGIYADFDTQINEQCFADIFTDEIIWTSRLDENIKDQIVFPLQEIVVPEESFMMIRTKEHPQVKRMLQQEIMEHNQRGGQRWKQCSYRQCLIIQCQRHYRDNTYKKGFD